MESSTFEIKSYPDMWESLGMNVERFEKMRCVLGDFFQTTFLSQENRPQRMDYFNWIVSEIQGLLRRDTAGISPRGISPRDILPTT